MPFVIVYNMIFVASLMFAEVYLQIAECKTINVNSDRDHARLQVAGTAIKRLNAMMDREPRWNKLIL